MPCGLHDVFSSGLRPLGDNLLYSIPNDIEIENVRQRFEVKECCIRVMQARFFAMTPTRSSPDALISGKVENLRHLCPVHSSRHGHSMSYSRLAGLGNENTNVFHGSLVFPKLPREAGKVKYLDFIHMVLI